MFDHFENVLYLLLQFMVHVSAWSEIAIYTTILKLHISKTNMKLLRDELVESTGVIRRLSQQLRDADTRNAKLEMLLAEFDMKYELAAAERDVVAKERDVAVKERDEALAKVERLEDTFQKVSEGKIEAEKALAYYDNAHAPPSNDTITRREINAEKKAERKRKNPTGRRGRKKDCKNTAISSKAESTVRYTPEKCRKCGGKNLRAARRECGGWAFCSRACLPGARRTSASIKSWSASWRPNDDPYRAETCTSPNS